jgi:hypothetical protein
MKVPSSSTVMATLTLLFASGLVSAGPLLPRAASLPAVPKTFASISDVKSYGSKLQVAAHSECSQTANPTVCDICEATASTAFAAALIICGATITVPPLVVVCGTAAALAYFNALQSCLA